MKQKKTSLIINGLKKVNSKDSNNTFINKYFIVLSLLALVSIFLAYSNHFSNGFHFDDDHSIVNNNAIREINVQKFFLDGTTISSLPTNQSYRPYLTLENAIDYKLSGGIGTKVFHIHIFFIFLLVCVLLGVFVKKILDKIAYSSYNHFWGLLVATTFGLLCANAETVNYIFQRAEIDSAFFILAGLVAFIKGGVWRRKYIYLLFPLIGFFAKEMTFVFAPLLFLYLLIFEENVDLLHFYRKEEFKKCKKAFLTVLPSIFLTIAYFVFYKIMLPPSWTTGGDNISNYLYLITQPLVICHYILTYFIPYNLSADTDWTVFPSIFDYRAIIGIIMILGLIYVALKASKNKKTRLFSFGILWFVISLLPTSSFMAYSEVLNDHRPFIPYLGLTIAFVFGFKYLLDKYFANTMKKRYFQSIFIILIMLFLGANAYGVRERNKVWKNGITLWHDVTEKSPKNGRGLMNYGVELMAIGDYSKAEIYFIKALSINPDYAYIYINLGILKEAAGDATAAENYFKTAISCNNFVHLSYYYYGQFLSKQERIEEAKVSLIHALEIVPDYYYAKKLLMDIYYKANDWENLISVAQNVLQTMPNDITAKMYLELSRDKR